MTVNADPSAIRHEIDVEVSLARAFQVFTQRFDAIKPREHNMMAVDIAETVMEPWPGGRIYDRGIDGTVCQWGRMLVVEAPNRLVFAWDISPYWQIQSDPTLASEVEVEFTSITDRSTRVVLEHRHLDRHGPGWPDERAAVDGADGWPLYLSRFGDVAGSAAP